MRKSIFTLFALILSTLSVFAQVDRSQVRQGNRDYKKGNYQEAEILYRKGLLADSLSNASNYNLGNTLFKMENYQEAAKYYEKVSDSLSRTKNGSDLYHNLGNAKLAQKDYQGAVEAYKDALRRAPSDMETKSNLAYAQKMLKNQQDQQNQDQNNDQDQNQNQDQNQQNQDQNKDQNQDKDQDKDQNKDNNDHNQNKDQNDNQQNQNNDDQQNDNQNDQGQAPPKISQQDAQQMLQAIQEKENDTQEKVKKEKALMVRSKQKEKNW